MKPYVWTPRDEEREIYRNESRENVEEALKDTERLHLFQGLHMQIQGVDNSAL